MTCTKTLVLKKKHFFLDSKSALNLSHKLDKKLKIPFKNYEFQNLKSKI